MQGVSKTTVGIALASIAAAAIAFAASGGGNGEPFDTFRCLAIYFWLIQIIVVSFGICILRCNKDRECESRCVRIFFYLFITVNILMFICLIRGHF